VRRVKYTTKSGSIYEVREVGEEYEVRQLAGRRHGSHLKDGEWHRAPIVEAGKRLVIYWGDYGATVTGPITATEWL
jgi:hypothetical protein